MSLLGLLLIASSWAQDHYTSEVVPFLVKPFAGEYPVSGMYDHDPDGTGDKRQLTAWNTVTWGKSGHDGWDWVMKKGTEILAAADGTVFEAGTHSTKCASGPEIATFARLAHEAPNGELYRTGYLHLSEVFVKTGETVKQGQVIGLSGSSGCSSGPHLHFSVQYISDRDTMKGERIDPYGWDGDRPDPRYINKGRRSAWLWLPGQSPLVYKTINDNKGAKGKGLVITRMSGTAWKDNINANNEWVEVAIGAEHGKDELDLTGVTLTDDSGETYNFPKGFVIHKGEPVMIFTGKGEDTNRALFWGRSEGIWDDEADCARLLNPKGEVKARQYWGRKKEGLCK